MTKKTLDMTAVWNDTISMIKGHKEASIAIAGVFFFLPAWLLNYYVGTPNIENADNIDQMVEIYLSHSEENQVYTNLYGVVNIFGLLVYYVILANKKVETAGQAIKKAVTLLPKYFFSFLILVFSIIIMAGFVIVIASFLPDSLYALSSIILIITILYLFMRFITLNGVIASGNERGIIDSIKYSWLLSRDSGWHILVMVFVTLIVMMVVNFIIGGAARFIFGLVGGSLQELLTAAVLAFVSAVFSLLTGALVISIYKHLEEKKAQKTE